MKIVIQRVKYATCRVDGEVVGKIENGLLVYVGFGPEDGTKEVDWSVDRAYKMRIFEDDAGKMNKSVLDVAGDVLWVPNFTLYCDASSRRPSFSGAMAFGDAKSLFDYLKQSVLKYTGKPVQCGVFGADMQIESIADGPINVVVETTK
ncbi:MAG: D-tyrosyl-tRNA(Tyr) deacylase [Clostridia bacterium]|nr:D-tyrosyl-tRNA(Tyr) deacylase [Clostridia bacterium]